MKGNYLRHLFCCGLAGMILAAMCGCYPKAVGPAGPDGKRLTWDQMNLDQRKAHMKNVVMPRAAEVFRTWRPKKYAVVDCSLCHGRGAATGNFDMPTAHLPRLSGDWTLGPEFKKFPDTTRLKLNRLVPLMSEALGKKPFSVATRRGFGCYSCHLGPSGPMFGN
ncbi:MAG TPA: hypothetical protein PKN50_00680 [Spirochaetota bacterium]|nr:hypothetical protein [Spirochaetota bacterium]HPV40352.1 hypothetical protein [Spirochaetota bacterium]